MTRLWINSYSPPKLDAFPLQKCELKIVCRVYPFDIRDLGRKNAVKRVAIL